MRNYLKVSPYIFSIIALLLVGGVLFSFYYGGYLKAVDTPVPSDNTTLPIPTDTSKKCVAMGCSGELCAPEGANLMSPCVYKNEYACYKNAKCEVQDDGKCGWTQSEELLVCLVGASN